MPDLGRVGGRLLNENLVRDGIDLAFDTDLLYLKVPPQTNLTITAGSFIPGQTYQIKTLGSTNFTLIGAASNTIGTRFTATNTGAGNGTAYYIKDDQDPNPVVSSGEGIGINLDNPAYDLEINNDVKTTNLISSDTSYIDNLLISTNTISTTLGGINIIPNGPGAKATFDRLGSLDGFFQPSLMFDGNVLHSFSNKNIIFNPNNSGTIELQRTTNVTGNVNVTGNITITGDLSKQGNLILGDDVIDLEGNQPETDTVDFNVPFSQSLIPGLDNSFDLGRDEDDSTSGRWSNVFVPDWTNIGTIRPDRTIVSDQLLLGESLNKIYAIQSNEDVIINPDTGITYIENTKWQNNDLTNLLNTPITLLSTGIGYVNFQSTNGFVIPAGTNAERPLTPEVGDTRWNTEVGYLECFDGSVYAVSTGGGIEVTTEIMEDLGNVYSLILG